MTAVWIIKAASLLGIFLFALLFGLIPFKLVGILSNKSDNSWAHKVISLLHCCAGGIFLGTTFLDLLPEVREGFSDIWIDQHWGDLEFPLAEFVVVLGFFLVVLLEHGILALQPYCTKGQPERGSQAEAGDEQLLKDQFLKTSGYGSVASTNVLLQKEESVQSMEDTKDSKSRSESECSQCENIEIAINQLDCDDATSKQKEDTKHIKGVGSLLLLLALSVHTIFEGLALGLLTNSADIWQLAFAIAVHKSVIVFSLGLRIAEEITNTRRGVFFIIGFSLMCPFGAAVGTIASEASANSIATQAISTVLQGIATGTFLQVTFFEVLHKEIGGGSHMIKVLATLLGFILMAVLIWVLHD